MVDSTNNQNQIKVKELFIKNYKGENDSWQVSANVNLESLTEYCKDNDKFLQECVEIGIEKGLCWVKDNQVHFLVEADNDVDDFLNFLCDKCKKRNNDVKFKKDLEENNILNYYVFSTNSFKIEENILDEVGELLEKYKNDRDKLLEVYKNCDEKVKDKFKKFIALFYYIFTKKGEDLEDYYFIAKDYLSEDKDLRSKFCDDYLECCTKLSVKIKHKLRRLFQYEDFPNVNEEKIKKETIKYILESGIGKINKTNELYDVTYESESNIHKCDSEIFLECIQELIGDKNIKEDDLKKYI